MFESNFMCSGDLHGLLPLRATTFETGLRQASLRLRRDHFFAFATM